MAIKITKENKTTMKVSKATITDEGKIVVEDEVINLLNLIQDHFEGCIFDITIAQKVSEEVE